ncbi:hypothetical protein SH2C18_03930 [Clostridium sediminicola]|uniref:hypothetical protein n=1 Tax=Clostridium sediminicola TaxID=3114879 RepID=UPI0031F1C55A
MNRKGVLFLVILVTFFIGSGIYSISSLRKNELKFYESIPGDVEKLAKDTLVNYEKESIEEIYNNFVDEVKNFQDARIKLNEITKYVKSKGKVDEVNIVGYNKSLNNSRNSRNSREFHSITYELKVDSGYLLYIVQITKEDNTYKLFRTDFNEIEESLSTLNGFNFKDKGVIHYVILFLVIGLLLFNFITAAICFSSTAKRKVLWCIFILFGIATVAFNWTTAEFGFNLISFQIPSATIRKTSFNGPYIMTLNFPLGAVLYWLKKHKENTFKTL